MPETQVVYQTAPAYQTRVVYQQPRVRTRVVYQQAPAIRQRVVYEQPRARMVYSQPAYNTRVAYQQPRRDRVVIRNNVRRDVISTSSIGDRREMKMQRRLMQD